MRLLIEFQTSLVLADANYFVDRARVRISGGMLQIFCDMIVVRLQIAEQDLGGDRRRDGDADTSNFAQVAVSELQLVDLIDFRKRCYVVAEGHADRMSQQRVIGWRGE